MNDDLNVGEIREESREWEAIPADVTERIRATAERMCKYFKRCRFDRDTLEAELTSAVLAGWSGYSAQAAPYADYAGGILIGKCIELLNTIRNKAREEGTRPLFSEQLVGRWMRAEVKAAEEALAKNIAGNALEKPFDYDEYGVSDRIRAVLAELDDRDRRICELLIMGLSLNGVCHALGLKKTNFYDRTWPRLRARLMRELGPCDGKDGEERR